MQSGRVVDLIPIVSNPDLCSLSYFEIDTNVDR